MADAAAQLQAELTDRELAALRDVLAERGRTPRRAGVATAGALGLATAGTAAADPSTTDSDPDVGLPSDRVDFWADGVEAQTTVNDRYHDGVNDLGTYVQESGSDAINLDAGDGNVVIARPAATSTVNTLELNLPSGLPMQGYVYHFAIKGGGGGIADALFTLNADRWDGGTDDADATSINSDRHFYRAVTYDGGTTWFADEIGAAQE